MTRAAFQLVAIAVVLTASPVRADTPFEWQPATPESQGMSKAKLDALRDDLAKWQTKAFLVIRNDRIVYEWYADGHGPEKTHYTASLAKALVGGMSLAVAITDGKITIDDPAAKFVTEWKDDPKKSKILVRHLGSHTSGLEDAEADDLPHNKLTGWKGDFWKRLPVPNDPFSLSRDKTKVLFEPGTRLHYSNPGIGMMTYCVTAAIKDDPQKDIRTLLRERVMRPIGVPDKGWSVGYGQTFTVDGLPLVGSWGGGGYTARAAARVGRLVLRDGDWDGKRILSKDAVKQVTTSADLPGACGMGWWTNAAGRYDYMPKDAVWGAGAGDQILLVVPSLNLIMVRNGATLVPPPKQKNKKADDEFALYHDPRAKVLFEPLIGAVTDRPQKSGAYFPPPESQGGWRALTKPDDIRTLAGMAPGKLAELKEWLLASDRRNFAALVIRNGYVVLDVERNLSSRTATGNAKSCAKAVCATVLGIASEESKSGKLPRRMSFDDPAFDFIPWAKPLSDPRKARITVKQLLNHTSGIAPESTGARNQGPWEYVLGHSGDAKTAKLAFDPGTDLGYTTHGLYHASLVCENVTGMPYDEYAIRRLLKPIGAEKWWFEQFDGGAKIGKHPSHALGMPARDLARIPYCLLRGGRWNDRQIIPSWFIRETAGPTHSVKGKKSFDREAESFSHGWELPGLLGGDRGRGIPKDARFKPGSGGQLIAFVPSLDLVVIRHTGSSGSWEYEEYLRRACACVLQGNPSPGPSPKRGGEKDETPRSLGGKGAGGLGFEAPRAGGLCPPYPPSPVITGIEWAPKESIVRRAKGSDNWPLTWADDDHLYTAYGDGNGFGPFIKPKLSMGFARVESGPADFNGINIRTPTGETLGDGAKGKKASGILMVDGVLYLWTRNAGNSQLAWSKDRGHAWEWADWKFTASFGCPTFLNFGKNYTGARDDFVYVYSHDNDSAYLPADRMVMARVPKNAIRDRNAYKFFTGLDAKGQPRWSKDIADRGAVFIHTGRCYRSGITYNAALKRYLWVQIVPGSEGKKPDTRFEGGFGIFDAPEPWGPWTTAFFTKKWDVGPGESASLPTKWMSPDGRTVHLVFSGNDTFSVRKATLLLAGK